MTLLGFDAVKSGVLNFSGSFDSLGFSFLVGLVLLVLGIYNLMKSFFKAKVIDKQIGLYWSGWKWKANPNDILAKKDACRLQDIVAIQVLEKLVESDDSPSFHCYELNLYLNNHQRHRLANHSHLKSIMIDANKIEDFIDVPVFTNVDV